MKNRNDLTSRIPWIPLADLPTPLEKMLHLSEILDSPKL